MNSADYNNLALRRTVAYAADGSFIPDGYVFTVSTNGKQNWTHDLRLNNVVLSTITVNSPFYVSTSLADNASVSTLNVSTLGVSTANIRAATVTNMGFQTLIGSSITTSSIQTPSVTGTTLGACTLFGSTATLGNAAISSLGVSTAFLSSFQAIQAITCTLATSSILFNVVNFSTSAICTLNANMINVTSSFMGSSILVTAISTSALAFQTLAGGSIVGSTLSLASSLNASSIATGGSIAFSTANGSTISTNNLLARSTFQASSMFASSLALSYAFSASTALISTMSSSYLAVASTATVSSITGSNLIYSTMVARSMTTNGAQINSTATVSTLNATNLSVQTLSGNIANVSSLGWVSTAQGSTLNLQNLNTSTLTATSSFQTEIIAQDIYFSTLQGSSLGATTVFVGSTLTVSTLLGSTAAISTLQATAIGFSTLQGSSVAMDTATVRSTLQASSITVTQLGYSTIAGSSIQSQVIIASSLTGSSINFVNIAFSTLVNSTITTNVLMPLQTLASSISANVIAVSTLLTISSTGTVGIGTTQANYPVTVSNTAFKSLEMNYASTTVSAFNAAGIVYSATHPTTHFRGEYAYAYGGAQVLATTTESQAIGYYAIDIANAGIFGTNTTGPLGATFYVDPNLAFFQGPRLGIGTNSPPWQLTVQQDEAFGNMTLNPMSAQAVITSATNGGSLKMGAYYTDPNFACAIQSSYIATGVDTGGALVLNPLGGNVGIGVAAPAFTLDLGIAGTFQTNQAQFSGPLGSPSYLKLVPQNNAIYFQVGTLLNTGSAAPFYLTNMGATATWLSVSNSGAVGIGTNTAIAPLHVFNAQGMSLASSVAVNYTQSSLLGFNYGGGATNGTRDSFQITTSVVNRDNGLGPYFDKGAQADLVFQRKTTATYAGAASDKTYTEVMRIGGATGNVGVGTNPASLLHIYGANPVLTLQSSTAVYGGGTCSIAFNTPQANYPLAQIQAIDVGVFPNVFQGSLTFSTQLNTFLVERMRITSTGLVGIGVSAPTYGFQIAQGSTSNLGEGLKVTATTTAVTAASAFALNTVVGGVLSGPVSGTYTFNVSSPTTAYFTFATGLTPGATYQAVLALSSGVSGATIIVSDNVSVTALPSTPLTTTLTNYTTSAFTIVGTTLIVQVLTPASGQKVNFSAITLTRLDTVATGFVGIGTAAPAYALQLAVDSAAKPATSSWTISSDERIKKDIVMADLDLCYNNVKSIPLKRYRWREEIFTEDQVRDRSRLGWIAQDVQKVFPKAVNTHNLACANGERIEDCLDLNVDQLYATMYGAMQKMMARLEELEEENAKITKWAVAAGFV